MQQQIAFIDLAFAVHAAGFRGDPAATAIAITEPESGRGRLLPDDGRVLEPNGSHSLGHWQINDIHFQSGGLLAGWDQAKVATDYREGARAAWVVSGQGASFGPWTTFDNDLHRPSLDAARVALDGRARLATSQTLIANLERQNATAAATAKSAQDALAACTARTADLESRASRAIALLRGEV